MMAFTYSSGSSIPGSENWTFYGASAYPGGWGAGIVYKYARDSNEQSGTWSGFGDIRLHVGVYRDAVFDSGTFEWYYDPPNSFSQFVPFTAGPLNGVYPIQSGFAAGITWFNAPVTNFYTANWSGSKGTLLINGGAMLVPSDGSGLTLNPSQVVDWNLQDAVFDPLPVANASFFSWYVTAVQAGFRSYYITG